MLCRCDLDLCQQVHLCDSALIRRSPKLMDDLLRRMCDWLKASKEDTVGIMNIRGVPFCFLMFFFNFLVFLLFVGYQFWFVLCMNAGTQIKNSMELCFRDFLLL